ncbi:DNA-directed RNA polymerase specialized sigma24 family protein [Microvirga lupini]|uniref:DNA-directed RNA polymerase specialized sigma24 family protein n=1 Tax=Microvirga lupini TaxID=420324 RepID=A0A7W4YZ07_9HYPH|nr:hypothetical protein [Microvirga lupini]MBB3021711.1 DNA-directed RNA polymerase specialized sigma24 family protein [Microvirga lupini]
MSLPDEQRAALHLVAIEGLSYQEAADADQAEPQQVAAEDLGDAGGDFGFEEDI